MEELFKKRKSMQLFRNSCKSVEQYLNIVNQDHSHLKLATRSPGASPCGAGRNNGRTAEVSEHHGFGNIGNTRAAPGVSDALPMDTTLSSPAGSTAVDLGRRVRAARLAHDLTLDTASRLCGVSRSTLSKIENGNMSPTFDVLQKIVVGLKIDLGELFGSVPKLNAGGRRALTRSGAGQRHAYRGYQMELLATDLAHKAMLPFRIRITAHSLDAFDDWGRHEGEEFLYVISGSVCLYSELYAPTQLEAGDSLYFDSRTGHAAISTSKEDAEVLWMATSATIPAAATQAAAPKKTARSRAKTTDV
jgi:transcriptional regulator with XRE-family HTH domain